MSSISTRERGDLSGKTIVEVIILVVLRGEECKVNATEVVGELDTVNRVVAVVGLQDVGVGVHVNFLERVRSPLDRESTNSQRTLGKAGVDVQIVREERVARGCISHPFNVGVYIAEVVEIVAIVDRSNSGRSFADATGDGQVEVLDDADVPTQRVLVVGSFGAKHSLILIDRRAFFGRSGDSEDIVLSGDSHSCLLGFESIDASAKRCDVSLQGVNVDAKGRQFISELVNEFLDVLDVGLGGEVAEVLSLGSLDSRDRLLKFRLGHVVA